MLRSGPAHINDVCTAMRDPCCNTMFLNLFQLTAAQSRLFFAALTEGNCNNTLRHICMSNCEVTDAMALELVGSGKEIT